MSRTAEWRRPLAAPALVVGLVVLAIGMIIVRDGTVPALERSTFHAVNDLPGWLYRPLWPFQQLGELVVGPVVAIVAACPAALPIGDSSADRNRCEAGSRNEW